LNGEKDNGVTIMLMDSKMDHGGIVAQEKVNIDIDTVEASSFEEQMAHIGGRVLARSIPMWLDGKITTQEQNHEQATFSKKLIKSDGELNLNDGPIDNYRKYSALKNSVGTYFFAETKKGKIRVKITDAEISGEKFEIKKVVPENGKVMNYADFLRGN
jgi:methionyl-tRNA formyltransferase